MAVDQNIILPFSAVAEVSEMEMFLLQAGSLRDAVSRLNLYFAKAIRINRRYTIRISRAVALLTVTLCD